MRSGRLKTRPADRGAGVPGKPTLNLKYGGAVMPRARLSSPQPLSREHNQVLGNVTPRCP